MNKEGNRTAVEPLRDQRQIDMISKLLQEEDKKTGQPAYIIWVLCVNGGFRVGDVLKLRVASVCEKGKIIKDYIDIHEEKENAHVRRQLSPKVKRAIKEYIDSLEWKTVKYQSYLFESKRRPEKPYTYQWFDNRLKLAAGIAGIDQRITTHVMRKTFAWNTYNFCRSRPDLYKTEADCIETVQRALKHKSMQVTRRYLGIEQEEIDNITSRFEYV